MLYVLDRLEEVEILQAEGEVRPTTVETATEETVQQLQVRIVTNCVSFLILLVSFPLAFVGFVSGGLNFLCVFYLNIFVNKSYVYSVPSFVNSGPASRA